MLAHIEAGALLPPLVVLQTLAKNPQLKLSVVKDYAARTLSAEGAAVEEDRKAIARFQEETASMRAEITELKTKVCHFHVPRWSIVVAARQSEVAMFQYLVRAHTVGLLH